jgi:O-methyltransferase
MARLRKLAGRLRGGDEELPPDLTDEERATLEAVRPYTMTSVERIVALTQAVEYTHRTAIPGAIVECGVWRGGSMMAVARTLLEAGAADRDLFLFDTYEGMSAPTDADRDLDGQSASRLLDESSPDEDEVWCYAGTEDVRANVESTGYPAELLHFVEGKVEETIPDRAPGEIALLRLDTDWYESTRHELEHLYPRLSDGGVLIVDDYGHWEGCRRAVDEYFAAEPNPVLLSRIDYAGRLAIKH